MDSAKNNICSSFRDSENLERKFLKWLDEHNPKLRGLIFPMIRRKYPEIFYYKQPLPSDTKVKGSVLSL